MAHEVPQSVSSGTPTVDQLRAALDKVMQLPPWEFYGMCDDERCFFCARHKPSDTRHADDEDQHDADCAWLLYRQTALSALSGQTAPQAWQPIETARKDGSQIHVAGRDWAAVGRWHVDRWYTHSAWHGARPLIDGKHSAHPTHWMPLPSPPFALSSASTPENEGSEQQQNETTKI